MAAVLQQAPGLKPKSLVDVPLLLNPEDHSVLMWQWDKHFAASLSNNAVCHSAQ